MESAKGALARDFRSHFWASFPRDAEREVNMAKVVNCACGYRFEAESDDELWEKAQQHIGSDHPDLVGKVTREEILAQAEIA